MAWAPIKLRKGGDVTFVGEAEGAGGGSLPVQAAYLGDYVTIADNNSGNLPWTTLLDGPDLLDRSTIDQPTVLASGVYAITAALDIATPGFTAGGFADVTLSGAQVTPSTSQFRGTDLCLITAVMLYAAGDAMAIQVTNRDGAASRDFALSGGVTVVKLA